MHSIRFLTTLLRHLALGACSVLIVGSLAAQSNTGTITGRVYDERTGIALQGAIVRVLGTNDLDYTTNDGRYLVNVPPGTVTVEVEYVGLDTFTQAVTVNAGATTTFNVPLTSTILQLDSFVVQESVRGQSLAINMQKVAAGIVNIVSEETFGQMPDGNIGSAIQRLPGLTVSEDQDGSPKDINIRGIEGAYNSVQIDGNRVPNSGGGSRAFDPRHLAADGVTNLEIIKAPTPDRDGDAIGGIINIVSRNAFQRDGRAFKLKIGGVYSELPSKWGHQASLRYSDIFSVGGGEKNLGLSLSVSSYRTNRYSVNADMDWVQVTPENNPELGLDQYDFPVWFFESTHFEYDNRITDTYGISGSIDYKLDDNNSFYVRPVYSYSKRKGTSFETDQDIDTRFQDKVDGRKTYAYLTHDSGAAIGDASRGWRGYIGTDDIADNNLYSLNFGGRHEREDSLLTYDFFYSYSKFVVEADNELDIRMRPSNPYFHQAYKIHQVHKGEVEVFVLNDRDPSDISLMRGNDLEVTTSTKEEDIYSARLDWEKKYDLERGQFTFKTGAKYRATEPRFDRTSIFHDLADGFPFASVVERTNRILFLKPKYFDVYPNRAVALLATNPEYFEFEEEDTLEDSWLGDYDAKEETSAAYLMGTYRFGRHTIIGGARYEKVKWSSINYRVSYLGGVGDVTTVNNGKEYDFVLPGIHLRHELTKNLILRESFNQSYGRPRLRDMTRGRFINEDGDILDGNPQLDPAFANNFEIQLEYYTANSGLYSVGYFYKDVEDFSYLESKQFDELDADGNPIPDPEGDLRHRKFQQGSTGKQQGIELIARQRLAFGPDWLKAFTASASSTFTESDATIPNRTDRDDLTLPGFSDYIFAGSLEYARGGFFARADYRYRSDFIEGLGSDIESDEYFAAEERVDAEMSYEIRRGLSVFVSGTNLTNRWQVSYQGYPQFVEDTNNAGRKYTVGMEYKF